MVNFANYWRRLAGTVNDYLERLVEAPPAEPYIPTDPAVEERKRNINALRRIVRYDGQVMVITDFGPTGPGQERALGASTVRVAEAIMHSEFALLNPLSVSVHLLRTRDNDGWRRQYTTADMIADELRSHGKAVSDPDIRHSDELGVFPDIADAVESVARTPGVTPDKFGHMAIVCALDLVGIVKGYQPEGTALLLHRDRQEPGDTQGFSYSVISRHDPFAQFRDG